MKGTVEFPLQMFPYTVLWMTFTVIMGAILHLDFLRISSVKLAEIKYTRSGQDEE